MLDNGLVGSEPLSKAIALFGRGVVVPRGMDAPEPWTGVEKVSVGAWQVNRPEATALLLRRKWQRREPAVVVLQVKPSMLMEPQTWDSEPYELTALTTPWLDLLFHFVYANNYILRPDGALVWPWVRPALAAGAADVDPGVEGDVRLKDGRIAWLDGGPRESVGWRSQTGEPVLVSVAPLESDGRGECKTPPQTGELSSDARSQCNTPLRAGGTPLMVGRLPVISWEQVEAGSLEPLAPAHDLEADLAPDQMRAVAHMGGAARVIAPAGSGKTRVLTARLRHLIRDRGYSRENIVGLAFNKRAQEEMESRCRDFHPRVRTLHSLGLEIVNEAWGPVNTMDETKVRGILDTLDIDRELQLNTDTLRPYIDALAAVRHRLESPTRSRMRVRKSPTSIAYSGGIVAI